VHRRQQRHLCAEATQTGQRIGYQTAPTAQGTHVAVSTTGRPICRDLGPQGKSLSHGAPTTLRHALTLPVLAQLRAPPDTPAAALQSAAPQLRGKAGSGAAQPPHPAP
jgi:hypothetical protein